MSTITSLLLFPLFFLCASSLAAQPNTSLLKVPRQNLLENLRITLEPDTARTYAFTDRRGGFWQGKTFRYDGDDYYGGYSIKGDIFLGDFLVYEDGSLIDRQQAVRAEMWPYQIRHIQNNGVTEAITVMDGKVGMVVTLSGGEADRFIPVMKNPAPEALVRTAGEVALFRIPASGRFLAVASAGGSWQKRNRVSNLPSSVNDDRLASHELLLAPAESDGEQHIIFRFGKNPDRLITETRASANNASEMVAARAESVRKLISDSWFSTGDPEFDNALHWAKIAGRDLVVDEFGKGIWAGLPWFHQAWGRDTFIALPGISLVNGRFEEAAEIITSFSDFQKKEQEDPLFGRVPNRVNSPEDIIYNTTDGTPWLIREFGEYVDYTGDLEFAREHFDVLRDANKGAILHFVDQLGFLTHDDADTWMDAKIENREAWSPRGDKAVEIQVLFHNQLVVSAEIAERIGETTLAAEWRALAVKLKKHFKRYFQRPGSGALFDHLNADGSQDPAIRPNQAFALSIPLRESLISPKTGSAVIREVISELTYPYGVASLSQDDAYFHSYHRDQIYHYDAAYHNGLCWQWIAGPVTSGMVAMGYERMAFELSRNLADQVLHNGMPGSLAELVIPGSGEEGLPTPSGTYSQAWSVSELVRNFYQDYLGIRPRMLERTVLIAPRLPKQLGDVAARITVGEGEVFVMRVETSDEMVTFHFEAENLKASLDLQIQLLNADYEEYQAILSLQPDQQITVVLADRNNMTLSADGETISMVPTGLKIPKPDTTLNFQTFELQSNLKSLSIPDFLEDIRTSNRE